MPPDYLDASLEASFSFGSENGDGSDDECLVPDVKLSKDASVSAAKGGNGRGRPSLQSKKSNSFRLNIRKSNRKISDVDDTGTGTGTEKGNSNLTSASTSKILPFDKRISSMPLTQREKLKRTANAKKTMQQLQMDRDNDMDFKFGRRREVMKVNDYSGGDSWRSKNVQNKNNSKSAKSIHSCPPAGSHGSNGNGHISRDDENASGPGYIGSLLQSFSTGTIREDEREVKNATASASASASLSASASASASLEKVQQAFSSDFSIGTYRSGAVEVRLSEKELRQAYIQCIKAIDKKEWHIVVRSIWTFGESLVGFQPTTSSSSLSSLSSSPFVINGKDYSHAKKNLMHVIASQEDVPEEVVDAMIEVNPEAAKAEDAHGCVPMHYAASVGRNEYVVEELLQCWPFAASRRNVDGDLPLHVAVWSGMGNENNAEVLLQAFPSGLITGNDVGGTPLHLACCGTSASPIIVEMLLEKHEDMGYPIRSVDVSGNAPIHIAVKTKAPVKVLQAFKNVFGHEPFYQVDMEDKTPLQTIMAMKSPDYPCINFIATAIPNAAKISMPNGTMPAVYAAEKGMPGHIVKQLLLCDMPIHFMMHSQREVTDVILRKHSYSWWHISTKHTRYASVLDDILANMASLHEVVALAQETDPEGFGCLYERAFGDVKTVFKNNLVFGERYEVIATFRALVRDGLLKVCALDWGERIAWEEIVDKKGNPQVLEMEDGYTAVNPTSAIDGTEVVYYSKPQREVLLHICVVESDQYHELLDEMDARKRFNFSHSDSQRLYNVHTFDARSIGCVGEMLCLSFERPLLTLQDVFDTSRFRRRKNAQWGRKTWNLLKRLAQVLKYFHTIGFVYGHVEPNTIAKFNGSNNWKLTDMRLTTPIGKPMRGSLRPGAPPESVSSSSLKPTGSSDKMMSISFDEDFQRTKAVNYSVSFDEVGPSVEFVPEDVIADPSWDVWSFGLIMGQLVLGQSMVLLPNFEQASDAHLKRLYQYDMDSLAKIQDAAMKLAGMKVANLLFKCLQPHPEDRPKSMEDILNDPYFDDISRIA